MRRCLGVLVALCLLASPGAASARTTARSLASTLATAGAPGVIALYENGRRLSVATAGVEQLGHPRRPRANDRFRIASLTKSFTAAVVLQLVHEHRLGLRDPVARWLPGLVPMAGAITIEDLLDHRSGLYDYSADPAVLPTYISGARPLGYRWQPGQLVALSAAHPLLFAPGQRASYSDTNYIVLGLVVQAVTHRSFATELRRRILKPLHLRRTSLASGEPRGRFLHGYVTPVGVLRAGPGGLADVSALDGSVAWAAGGLLSDARDVARFYRALFAGRLVSPRLLRLMRSPLSAIASPLAKSDAYGLGLQRYRYGCGDVWGHSGDFPGYTTLARASDHGRRVVVVAIDTDTIGPGLGTKITPQVEALYCGT